MQYYFTVPSYLYTPWHKLIALEAPVYLTGGYIDGDSIHEHFPSILEDKSYRYPLSATLTG